MPVFNIPRPTRPQPGQSPKPANEYARSNNRNRAAEFNAKPGYRQYTQPQQPMKPAVMNPVKRPPVQTTQPVNPGLTGQANVFPPAAPKPDYGRFNRPIGGSLQPIGGAFGQRSGSLSEMLRNRFAGQFGDQTLPVMPQFGQRI